MPVVKAPFSLDLMQAAISFANLSGVLSPKTGAKISGAAFAVLPQLNPPDFQVESGMELCVQVQVALPNLEKPVYAYIPYEVLTQVATQFAQNVLFRDALGEERALVRLRVVGARANNLQLEIDASENLLDFMLTKET